MEWIRYHPKISATVAGIVTLFVIVFLWIQISPSHKDTGSAIGEVPVPSYTPLPTLPTVSPTGSPTGTPTGTGGGTTSGGLSSLSGFTGGSHAASGGTMNMPGLQGGSLYKNLPKHSINLRVTSSAPIGTVGYVIPTSTYHSRGVVKNVGTFWTLSTTVYGSPDYAQIFFQAGAQGFPVTCTITVDGHVTEHRSTEGPYGQMVCQG